MTPYLTNDPQPNYPHFQHKWMIISLLQPKYEGAKEGPRKKRKWQSPPVSLKLIDSLIIWYNKSRSIPRLTHSQPLSPKTKFYLTNWHGNHEITISYYQVIHTQPKTLALQDTLTTYGMMWLSDTFSFQLLTHNLKAAFPSILRPMIQFLDIKN
jgi:hypothetical protein